MNHKGECRVWPLHSRHQFPFRSFGAKPLEQHSMHFLQCPCTLFLWFKKEKQGSKLQYDVKMIMISIIVIYEINLWSQIHHTSMLRIWQAIHSISSKCQSLLKLVFAWRKFDIFGFYGIPIIIASQIMNKLSNEILSCAWFEFHQKVEGMLIFLNRPSTSKPRLAMRRTNKQLILFTIMVL